MPPNDDPPGPSRRRPLGRGPGTPRQGAAAGGEPPERELRDGEDYGPESPGAASAAPAQGTGSPVAPDPGAGAHANPTSPLPEAGGRSHAPERFALHDGDGPEGLDSPEAASSAPAPGVDSPVPPVPEARVESQAPDRRTPRDGDGDGSPRRDEGGDGAEDLESPEAASVAPARGTGSPVLSVSGGEPPEPARRSQHDGEGDDDRPQGRDGGGDGAEARVAGGGGDARFTVRLVNFEGPFDLLLQLISKHKLDVTEVALSKVTDEFMAYIRAMGPDWDLDQTTEFLVVAATLLDLKAARLLPAAEVEDEADLALLEARDLLFARLLQYRAYKQIADIFDRRLEEEARRYPRTVGLEAHLAELLPEVVISIGAEGFAKLAVKAMQPKPKPQVYVDHIHAPLVSVREQAEVVVALLRERGRASFRELSEDAPDTLTVVARFLALLELYREKAVALDQEEALGELTVVWAGGGAGAVAVTDEFDQVVEEKQ
ncbi:segregation/condensation protein A [Streptomyces pristinaespiralis]|uniref:segregation/condensation protein A n=1 Tax=Streptomyces pristinaespiralis TaxID=38300 RepID=UPI003832FC6D